MLKNKATAKVLRPSLAPIREKPLSHFISEHSLSEVQAFSIMKKLCEAVDALHKQGTLHLDIRPDTIMFVLETGVLRLTDPQTRVPIGTIGLPSVITDDYAHQDIIDADDLKTVLPLTTSHDIYAALVTVLQVLKSVQKTPGLDEKIDQIKDKAYDWNGNDRPPMCLPSLAELKVFAEEQDSSRNSKRVKFQK